MSGSAHLIIALQELNETLKEGFASMRTELSRINSSIDLIPSPPDLDKIEETLKTIATVAIDKNDILDNIANALKRDDNKRQKISKKRGV